MKVHFQVVRYKNIMSAGNQMTEVRLDKAPTTLVTGKNGSGKSTMIEAICFALFGKPYREINKPALLNTINNKNLVVEIEFTVMGKQYKVIRGIKPNVFEIYVDGEMLNQDAASMDQQDYLEQVILQMSHKTFTKIAIVGNATYKPFMKFTAAERRAMIDELLDIGVYTKMGKALKARADITKEKLRDLEAKLSVQIDKTNLQKSYITNLHADRTKKIAETRDKIDASLALVEETEKLLEPLETERNHLSDQIVDVDGLREKQQTLRDLRTQMNSKIDRLNADIEFFRDHDDCPTCKQRISDDFRVATIADREKTVAPVLTGMQKLGANMNQIKEQLDKVTELQTKIRSIDNEIRELQGKIKTESQYIAKLQKDIAAEEATPTVDIDAEKVKLKAMAKETVELMTAKDAEAEQKMYFDIAAMMLKDSGIKSKVIEEYLPSINQYINEYLHQLDLFVGFELDGTFTETIKSRGRDTFAYESFSEGEKLKIDLSILFTWITISRLKNTVSCNILMFDEVLDRGLDTDSSGLVVSILEQLSKDSNIFVISHHPELYFDKMESHLKFEKVNNYSVLVD